MKVKWIVESVVCMPTTLRLARYIEKTKTNDKTSFCNWLPGCDTATISQCEEWVWFGFFV